MGEVLVITVPLVLLIALLTAARLARTRRHAPSATVRLLLVDGSVHRELADGRREAVRLDDLVEVEVVCTPVATADGATAFAVLTGATEGSGCLVPLGVGFEGEVVVELSRLPGFDLGEWNTAQERRPPSRTVVWTARSS